MNLFQMLRWTNEVEALLSAIAAADINVVEKDGQTLLHAAIAYQKPEIGSALIKRRIDVNRQDNKGMTPLHYTAWHNAPQLAELILQHGGDPNIRDRHGNTALWYAIQFAKGDYTLVERLLSAGADVTITNNQGKSSLDIAKQINDNCLTALLTDEA